MPNQFHRDAITRVLAYVEKNKDRELSLDEISKIARVSKFHFHRLFSAHMGVSIGQYLKLKRLEKGMFELIYTKNSTLHIALNSGYEAHAAFARAFKKEFGCSPREFKEKCENDRRLAMSKLATRKPDFLGFKERIDTPIYYVRKTGSYFTSASEAWDELLLNLQPQSADLSNMESFGISHDNPHEEGIQEKDLRFDACVAIESLPTAIRESVTVAQKNLDGGKYAVFLHRGPYELLGDSFHYIYGHWLYEENALLRDVPPFVRYRHLLEKDRNSQDLETEIFIPVK